MACPYYVLNHGEYYCIQNDDCINENFYYEYCRTEDYSDCPFYEEEFSEGCYLTSACIRAKGLSDDCYELVIMRYFRDTWLKSTKEGEAVIRRYYEIAPKIVSTINKTKNSKFVYEMLYEKMVKICVEFIEDKKYQEALDLYLKVTLQLEKKYF